MGDDKSKKQNFHYYPDNISGPKLKFWKRKYKYDAKDSNSPAARIAQPSDTDIVILYVPQLSDSFSANWNGQQVVSSIAQGSQTFTDTLIGEAKAKALEQAKVLSTKFVGERAVSSLSASVGKAIIQNQMLIYNGPNFSEVNFNFDLVPRSEKEAIHIGNILDFFQKCITANTNFPPTDDFVLTIDFPDVFNIKLFNDGGSNVSTFCDYEDMALTSCSVSFGQDHSTTFFKNTMVPVYTSMQLSFKKVRLFGGSKTEMKKTPEKTAEEVKSAKVADDEKRKEAAFTKRH